MAKRISIINFKGGVGKTTLAFHVATGLARGPRGKKVLLVDVDHQSSLSLVCLPGERWDKAVDDGGTVTEIFRWLVGHRADRPVSNKIIMSSPLKGYPKLDLIPSSLYLDNMELELTTSAHVQLVAGKMGSSYTSGYDSRTSICRWLEGNVNTRVDEYDYVIFDCPPATKIASQNAIAASHGYIVPTIPEAVMQRGVPNVITMIKNVDSFIKEESRKVPKVRGRLRGDRVWVPDTKFMGLAVTWVRPQTTDHMEHLGRLERLARWHGWHMFKPYIPHTTITSKALARNRPVWDMPNSELKRKLLTVGVGKQGIDVSYRALVKQIKGRIDRL